MDDSEVDARVSVFVEKMNDALDEAFGKEANVSVVIGMQVGEHGVLSSNLSPCAVGPALHDMHSMAVEEHDAYHAPDGAAPYMDQSIDKVPEEVRQQALAFAEAHGVAVEDIIFRSPVTMTDLESAPDWLTPVEGVEDGEQIVQTGDDDIASPPPTFDAFGLTAKDEADIAALNADTDED